MNVPKLRFKEFKDEWQSINLATVFQYFATNSFSRDQLSESGILKNLHYGDIHRKYNSIVNENDEITSYVKDINYDNKYELLKNNDLIFADASEDYEGIGKAVEVVNVNNKTISGLHTILARDNLNIFAPMFKGYYFNSSIIHNQLRVLANGFKVYGISKDSINKLNIKVPSTNEQSKIANTLYLLDKKIELQSKKIEDLKLFKLSKYSSVFSKTNNKIKLSDICIIEKGKQINSDLLIEKGNYYMLNGGILPSGYLNEYNTNENTVTISEGGNSCGYVNFNKTKFWCGGHCYKITSPSVNTSYLYHLLKHNEKIIMDLRVGSGLPNIQKKDLEALKLSIHKNDEQLKIGILFDTFDKKISLETDKLNKFKELKKALMQVMFV